MCVKIEIGHLPNSIDSFLQRFRQILRKKVLLYKHITNFFVDKLFYYCFLDPRHDQLEHELEIAYTNFILK
jgi:hypothetical protein